MIKEKKIHNKNDELSLYLSEKRKKQRPSLLENVKMEPLITHGKTDLKSHGPLGSGHLGLPQGTKPGSRTWFGKAPVEWVELASCAV